MPKPGSTQITVSIPLREGYEKLAADRAEDFFKQTGIRTNISVQQYLQLLLDKIEAGEIVV